MVKKILVVDDEVDLLSVVSVRLRSLNCEVVTAINGKEALEMIKRSKPDLILLDLVLPVMNGYDLCKVLKADDRFKDIPVILFTASVIRDVKEKTQQLGAQDYVMKPFDPKILIEKIKRLIS